MVVLQLLLDECLGAVHRDGGVLAGEAVAEALDEECLVQDVGAVVGLLGGSGINLILHLLANLDACQTCLLAFVSFGERLLLEAFQEIYDVSRVDAHALSQVPFQSVGVCTTEVVAEDIYADRIDHFNGLFRLLILLDVLLGSSCAQRDAGAES